MWPPSDPPSAAATPLRGTPQDPLRAPLLDRVAGAGAGDAGSDALSRLAHDIERLLNTRRPGMRTGLAAPRPPGLLGYGLAHEGGASNPHGTQGLACAIEEALRQHEPRLTETSVRVSPEGGSPGRLRVTIDARLVPRLEAVSLKAQAWLTPWRVHLLRAAPGRGPS